MDLLFLSFGSRLQTRTLPCINCHIEVACLMSTCRGLGCRGSKHLAPRKTFNQVMISRLPLGFDCLSPQPGARGGQHPMSVFLPVLPVDYRAARSFYNFHSKHFPERCRDRLCSLYVSALISTVVITGRKQIEHNVSSETILSLDIT